jgi:hypothetical protein
MEAISKQLLHCHDHMSDVLEISVNNHYFHESLEKQTHNT